MDDERVRGHRRAEGREVEPAGQLTITGLAALKVSADPLRLRLVDALRRAPATVKELADALDVSPKSLYYHIGLLERHGLIRVVATRLVSGITEKRYRATAYLFIFEDLAPVGAAPGARDGLAAIESILDITRAEVHRSVTDGTLDLWDAAAPERALHNDWTLLRLSPVRVAELAARLRALRDEYAPADALTAGEGGAGAAGDGDGTDGTYRLLLTLFPTYPRGAQPATLSSARDD